MTFRAAVLIILPVLHTPARERFPNLSPLAQRVIDDIERAHEPNYSSNEPTLQRLVLGLARGGRLLAINELGERVEACGGHVWLNGDEVELSLNVGKRWSFYRAPAGKQGERGRVIGMPPDYDNLNPEEAKYRGHNWHPSVQLPGQVFDAAYVFLALADFYPARRASGCDDCRLGTVEEATNGPGRLFVACSCQDEEEREEEAAEPTPAEPVADLRWAREEPGAWFSGAALRALVPVEVAA